MAKKIKKEHGHWHLPDGLHHLLRECMAKEPNRYGINGIYAGDNTLATTDGRRLLEVQIEHEISLGSYFCTDDGYFLDTLDGNFPKYEDIFPKKAQRQRLVHISGYGKEIIGIVLGKLIAAGCLIDIDLLYGPAKLLRQVEPMDITVFVYRKGPGLRPFVLEAETKFGPIRYLQMTIPPGSVTMEGD